MIIMDSTSVLPIKNKINLFTTEVNIVFSIRNRDKMITVPFDLYMLRGDHISV